MERIDERTVTLTDAEWVVKEWHDTLLDRGFGPADALADIEERVPVLGVTATVVRDRDFRAYLLT